MKASSSSHWSHGSSVRRVKCSISSSYLFELIKREERQREIKLDKRDMRSAYAIVEMQRSITQGSSEPFFLPSVGRIQVSKEEIVQLVGADTVTPAPPGHALSFFVSASFFNMLCPGRVEEGRRRRTSSVPIKKTFDSFPAHHRPTICCNETFSFRFSWKLFHSKQTTVLPGIDRIGQGWSMRWLLESFFLPPLFSFSPSH